MKLHNSYTVKTKKGTFTALNTLAADFANKLAAHPRWAKFLTLTAEDGSRVCAPALLTFVNADVSRGGALRAQYAATVRTEIKKYVRVSLDCDDAGSAMSFAEINASGDGEEAAITVTVNADIRTDGVLLSAGDNPLVRMLLGCGEEISPYILYGDCDYPDRPCVRKKALLGPPLETQIVSSDGNLTLKSVEPAYGCELLLMHGDKAVARALRPYEITARAFVTTVDENDKVMFSDRPLEDVFNCKLDGAYMAPPEPETIFDGIADALDGKVMSLGLDGEVRSDPSGKYVALVTTTYVDVYETDSLDLNRHVLHVERNGEDVEIMRGGSLSLWGDTTLTVYERDEDGAYTNFSVDLPVSNTRVIMREGNRYHAGYRRSNAYYRYEVTREGATRKEQTRVTATIAVAGRIGDRLAFADKTLRVKGIDEDYSSEYNVSVLSSRTSPRTTVGIGDGFILTVEDGKGFVYDLLHDKVTQVSGSAKCNGKLVYDEDSVYIFDCLNGLRKVEGDYVLGNNASACLAGRALFVLRDGELYAYYASGSNKVISFPSGSAGKSFKATIRERVYSGVGQPAGFTLKIG